MSKYTFNNRTFTEQAVLKQAKSKGLSLEDYLNEYPEVKLVEPKKGKGDSRWGEKVQTVKGGKFVSELPKYEDKHVTYNQLTDYKWWRGEGDVIETLEGIYGDDFEFDDELAHVGIGGLMGDRIRVYNKRSKKELIIDLPTGFNLVGGMGTKGKYDVGGWAEVHQKIKDFIDNSNIEDEDQQEFANDTNLNWEQEYGNEGGFEVVNRTDPRWQNTKLEELIAKGDKKGIEYGLKKLSRKKLNFQETLDLKSTIIQHINRAIESPQAYDIDLREDKASYGREVNDEEADRIKWAVYDKLNEELPYMIPKDQFDKIVGNFGTGNLLRTTIDKRNAKVSLELKRQGEETTEGKTGTEMVNSGDDFSVNFDNKWRKNLNGDLKQKNEILESKYFVAEAAYLKLDNERNDKTKKITQEKYRELTRQMKDEKIKMDGYKAEVMKMGEKYNTFWQGKSEKELTDWFIDNNHDPYRAEQKAKFYSSYDPTEAASDVMTTNPNIGMREAYDIAIGNSLGVGKNIEKAMKTTFVTINNPFPFGENKETFGFTPGSLEWRRAHKIVRLAKELNLVEYYPDGKMKNIEVSVYDALTGLGYNGRDFDNAWNPFDKTVPFARKLKGRWISDRHINVLKDMEATYDRNNIQTTMLYDIRNLNIGPKGMHKVGGDDSHNLPTSVASWVSNVAGQALEFSGQEFFNQSPYQSSKLRSNITSTFTGGRHDNFTSRLKLNQFHTIAAQHNDFYKDKIASGEAKSIMFTEDELDHIEQGFGEVSSEMLGGFVPIMAKLGVITLATRGIGTIPAIARIASTIKLGRYMSTWGKVKYHMASAALLEAQMRTAGFKPTSGLAFYTGGQLGGAVKLGGWLNWANPLFQKTLMAGVTGAGSMEFAGITELAWDVMKGEANWERDFKALYGDLDEVQQRLLSSALAFGINGLHKVDYRKGRDLYPAWAKDRVVQSIIAKQKKLQELGTEDVSKLTGKEKVDRAMEMAKLEKELGIELPKGFEKLSEKNRDKWLTLEHSKQDVKALWRNLELNALLDKNLPIEELRKNVKEIVAKPFNKAMKELTDGAHVDVEIDFINETVNTKTGEKSAFWDMAVEIGKDGIPRTKMIPSKDEARLATDGSNKMIFSRQAFHNGKVVHEFTHVMLKALFKGNKELENKFVGKIREIFGEYEFHVGEDEQGNLRVVSGKEMAAQIKEKYEIDYRTKKGKNLANEEFLAFMGEFLASPQMYNKYVAPSFLKEIKQEVLNTFRGSGYTPKISEPMDLIKVFTNFGRATLKGNKKQILQNARALSNLRKVDFLGIEKVISEQGGVEAMKQKSKRLFDKEFEGEANVMNAKEKKAELQEKLKEEQNKFIKDKEGKSPEEVAAIRAKFQEAQRAIRDDIADQSAIISGKRDYAKEISNFRAENKGNPKAINRFIAKLNAEVSENMVNVRGIELLHTREVDGKEVQGIWNERNKLIKQRDETFPEQLVRGDINKRELKNKLSDVNRRLTEIEKAVDWKTWNKLAGDLAIINAGKIENVTKAAYKLGAAYGEGRIGKSELKAALNAQFLEVVADYNFVTPKGKAEFGAYMNTALPERIGAAYKMETEGAAPKGVVIVGLEKAENVVDTGVPIIESNLKTKVSKKEKVKVSKKEKELNAVLELETKGSEALERIKIDLAAQAEINKMLKPEGVTNSKSMYETALNKYKKETINDIPIKKGGKRRYTDKEAEELAKTTTWDNVNSGVIQELAPDAINAMLGITPKPGIIPNGSIKNAQDWMDVNVGEFLKIMKWNSAIVPGEGIPKRMEAISMNLPKKWLDTFYHEASIAELKELGFKVSKTTGRVDTPAGPRPKILNKGITVEQIREFVGIKPDGTRIVDRNLSSNVKGMAIILDKAVSNQFIRKALENGSVELGVEYNAKDVVNRMKNGIPPHLASKNLYLGFGKKFGISAEEAKRNVGAWARGANAIWIDNKIIGIPKEQVKFLEKLSKDAPGLKSAILELHNHIVDAYKEVHVIKTAKGSVEYHTTNTVITPEYKASIEGVAETMGISGKQYNKLLIEAAEKTTTGIWSKHTDKDTGEKIDILDRKAVVLINKVAGEYVKLLPKDMSLTLAMALSGSPLSGKTGKRTFSNSFAEHFKLKNKYKKEKKPDGKRRYNDKQAEKLAKKEAWDIVTKWEKGEKVEAEHKEHLDNVKGKTGLFVKNKKDEIVELNYRDPLLTDFRKNIENNLGKNTLEAFEGLNMKDLKTGSQLATAYKKARELYAEGKIEAGDAVLAKSFTALDASTKKAMYQATGLAMEQLILKSKKGDSKAISERLQFIFRIAKNNTDLTEGERVFTSNRFMRLVAGEKMGLKSPLVQKLMKEDGLSLKEAMEKDKGKVEHSKISLNASFEKAFSVVSGMWRIEGEKIARDYIGIFSSVGILDVIDLRGTKTSAALLSRMAKAREELKNYKEWVDGKFTGRNLEDVLIEQVAKDLQALGAKVSIQTVKDKYLTDAVNNYIAEPSAASVRNVKQTIKNKESVKRSAAHNRNIATKAKIPISKKATNAEVLRSMRLFEDARSKGRKADKEKKGMSTFDFDETVGVSENYIFATKGKETKKIASHEWPFVGEQLRSEGWKLDFTDFNKVTKGKPGPLMEKLKNQIKKFGNKNVFILTARDQKSAKAIHEWLKSEGVDIPLKNITGLGNSTGEAKAMWMLEKFAEGYNDMYFVDDALPNVKAVRNVLDQLDIKSKVQQAKMASKKLFSSEFNKIIEETTGFKAGYEVGKPKARILGKGKVTQTLILPGAQDFMGLMYNFMGKGKRGEAHKKFFEDNLSKPFARGWTDMLTHRQGILDDFKRLKKITPEINGNLAKTGNKYRHGFSDIAGLKTPSTWKNVPGSKYSYEHAVRVYLWNKSGFEAPGLSTRDAKLLSETVMNDPILKNYADQLGALTKESKGYIEPSEYWVNETIMSDVYKLTQERGMKKYLAEFIENKNLIFSEANMQKVEATQGRPFREALEDVLYRMEKGTNRPTGSSRETSMFMNWINGSVGATMNWNMRSAVIQQLSTINFMNWTDNNPLMAAKAFTNQPQFWKDYATIWNSSVMRQRRKGLKINVHESEIADAVSVGGARGAFNYFLKLGFTPTMLADSHAISFGGATFYRNRVNTYLKKGFDRIEAETQAFKDFQTRSEPTQQSSRPDLVSKWQADPILGRLIFPFSNVNTQNARRGEKGVRDAKNNRGDMKDNLSKAGNYGLLQPLLYGGLSAGLIALYLDEDEDFTKKEKTDKVWRTANTMLDSQLRGLGYPGAVVSAGKNTLLEYHKQEQKPRHLRDHTYTMLQMTSVSPVVNIKLRNIYGGLQTEKYNEAVIKEMPYWDLDNPHWMAKAQIIQGTTNAPTGRFMYKRMNMKEAIDADNQWWQRAHHLGGWAPWDVGTEIEEIEMYKRIIEQRKEAQKKSKKKKKKKKSSGKFKTVKYKTVKY